VARDPSRRSVIIGWVLLAAFALVTAVTGGATQTPRVFQVAYLVGFAGYFVLLFEIRRASDEARLGSWRAWFAGMVVLRLALVATPPSDDANRYVWEGRVQNAGVSPYVVAPNDERLASLQDDVWHGINHPDFPAIYPPLAELEFRLLATLDPSTLAIKLVHMAWDILIVALLAPVLRRRGLRAHLAAAYGLCPLVLTAFAVEGHLDSLMLLLTLASIASFDRRWLAAAGVALGSAIAAKTVVVILLPWFVLRSWKVATVAAVTTACWYLPFGTTGLAGLLNLRQFGELKAFFDLPGAFHLLDMNSHTGRWIALGALVLAAVVCAWRVRDLVVYAVLALSAVVVTLPVVHFWYITWPLLLTPLIFRWIWPVTAAAFVTYFEAWVHAQGAGAWTMPDAAPLVTWLVFVTMCVVALVQRRTGNRAPGEPVDATPDAPGEFP